MSIPFERCSRQTSYHIKGVGGKILSLLFLLFLHMLYIYLSLFQKVLTDSLILNGSDFLNIWRSVVGAKIGLKIGQKYSVLTRNLKKELQNTTHSPLDCVIWKFAQRYLSVIKKTWQEWIFQFCVSTKYCKNCDFVKFFAPLRSTLRYS